MRVIDAPNRLNSRRFEHVRSKPLLSLAAQTVWHGSALRKALGAGADELLAEAREEVVRCGEVIDDVAARANPPPLMLIVDGFVRVYYTSPRGRQATIRYMTTGDVVGLPVVLAPELTIGGSMMAAQSMGPSTILHLSPRALRRVAESDAKNMWPLFTELAKSLVTGQRFLLQNVFQPIRARMARHMLDLSESRGDRLVVTATQQDIADAIGSVREVISRVVLEFRDEGLIRREDGAYVILDRVRLHMVSKEES